ncbi:MAG: histidine--tRNA ligase [Legionellales bacterium]|nr:histidine--tRNA ligase [Legionellales bacterium]HBH10509.1 histidine--tRNA ligase [Gammaproteobacteria bacterium]|tara:strand:- start:198 stop:1466 length:1269 start_codon:yes stop_codon:yes gene_type:complete
MTKLQAIRGMHDILMDETPNWQFVEKTIQYILNQYGYKEIRLPILEKTELFENSIGDNTDIVSKEMYSFEDKNKMSLTLRPEGTASCVRAGIEHGLFHNKTQRLWYIGPMFRYERPQKGRQRQFHQLGVEAFGLKGPDVDAEQIMMSNRIWKKLNIKNINLEINSLGTTESRLNYRKVLVDYFTDNKNELDNDSLIRLETNPLRILDSKNSDIKSLINNAPSISEYLDSESKDHFAQLTEILEHGNVKFTINSKLVRGLDYYGKTVYEWTTTELGTQDTVCAGGRYDNLIENHGSASTPAVGFAIGIERLLELINFKNILDKSTPDIYLLVSGKNTEKHGLLLAEEVRNQLPDVKILTNCGNESLKSQFKKADKSGAEIALVLAEDELEKKELTVKYLRKEKAQITIKWNEISNFLNKTLFN